MVIFYQCYILTYTYTNHTIHIQAETGGLCSSGSNSFINYCFRFFDTRRETQFLKVFRNHTMLTQPPTFGTSRGFLDLNSFLPVEIRKTQLFDSMANTPTLNWLFSKSSNSQDHLFRTWRHPHSSNIPYLGFIMTMVIVISFAHEHKTAPNDFSPELLTRVAQSPTKLNDTV